MQEVQYFLVSLIQLADFWAFKYASNGKCICLVLENSNYYLCDNANRVISCHSLGQARTSFKESSRDVDYAHSFEVVFNSVRCELSFTVLKEVKGRHCRQDLREQFVNPIVFPFESPNVSLAFSLHFFCLFMSYDTHLRRSIPVLPHVSAASFRPEAKNFISLSIRQHFFAKQTGKSRV